MQEQGRHTRVCSRRSLKAGGSAHLSLSMPDPALVNTDTLFRDAFPVLSWSWLLYIPAKQHNAVSSGLPSGVHLPSAQLINPNTKACKVTQIYFSDSKGAALRPFSFGFCLCLEENAHIPFSRVL